MTQQVLGQVDQLLIEKCVTECLDKQRTYHFALIAALVAIYGAVSGLVLWSVQNSGKLAGEAAAREAVQQEIKGAKKAIEDDRSAVEKLFGDTSSLHAKTEFIFKQAETTGTAATRLEKEMAVANQKLTTVNRMLGENYEKIAKQLADDPEFRTQVIKDTVPRLAELQTTINALQEKLSRLGKFSVWKSGTAHVPMENKPTKSYFVTLEGMPENARVPLTSQALGKGPALPGGIDGVGPMFHFNSRVEKGGFLIVLTDFSNVGYDKTVHVDWAVIVTE